MTAPTPALRREAPVCLVRWAEARRTERPTPTTVRRTKAAAA